MTFALLNMPSFSDTTTNCRGAWAGGQGWGGFEGCGGGEGGVGRAGVEAGGMQGEGSKGMWRARHPPNHTRVALPAVTAARSGRRVGRQAAHLALRKVLLDHAADVLGVVEIQGGVHLGGGTWRREGGSEGSARGGGRPAGSACDDKHHAPPARLPP